MKFFVQIAFISLIFSAYPLSFAYAQDDVVDETSHAPVIEGDKKEVIKESLVDKEGILTLEEAKAFINESPTAKDVDKGVVEPITNNIYYDIYSRSLAFRESAKDLRASIDSRRIKYSEPRTNTIEAYRVKQEKVYSAEMAAYDKAEEGTDMIYPSYEDEMVDEISSDDIMAQNEEAEPSGGLTETDIPSKEGDEDLKKKVITSDDAPDFDPSKL